MMINLIVIITKKIDKPNFWLLYTLGTCVLISNSFNYYPLAQSYPLSSTRHGPKKILKMIKYLYI